jgi:tryptophan-rich sensory protein
MAGRMFTAQGLGTWYSSLIKPSYTPPGSLIGIFWTIIYIFTALSLILFVNKGRGSGSFWLIACLYVINGIFNAAWSYIFFTEHLLGLAVIDAVLIGITVFTMIMVVRPYSLAASVLLVPYFVWVCFATFLTFMIFRLNQI